MCVRTAFAMAAMIGIAVSAASASAREVVPFDGRVSPGTVLIKTGERRLYFVRGDGTALRYRVAVGKPGKQWFGEAQIDGKYVSPAWSPPAEVKRDNPRLPDVIPGGAPNNPDGRTGAHPRASTNTPSTAPTARAPSAPTRPMAASACSTRTSSISTIR